jgi:hypothetical protein
METSNPWLKGISISSEGAWATPKAVDERSKLNTRNNPAIGAALSNLRRFRSIHYLDTAHVGFVPQKPKVGAFFLLV